MTEKNFVQKLYLPSRGDKCYDLSDHQGKLSKEYFEGLKKQGVKCVILRSSYTKCAHFKLKVDAHFHNNIKNAIAAKMHIGIYHYSSAINEKESPKEAAFCLETIDPYREHIDLPVAMDCEFGKVVDGEKPRFTAAVAKKQGKSGMGRIVRAFNETIRDAGYEPMLYANLTMFNNYLPANIHKEYKIWIAQYNDECDYKHSYYLWQYTSSNGKLDKNYFGSQDTKKVIDGIVLPARGYFKKGDKGEDVKKVQKKLNKANEGVQRALMPLLACDGEFGDLTDKAVRFFQYIEGIAEDGEVGKTALTHLIDVKVDGARMATNWAVAIAFDNRFTYGAGERGHRCGCYFCKTNTGTRKYIKQKSGEPKYVKDSNGIKHTYEMTYCCNTFITAAYAHGAQDKVIYDICHRGSCCGMDPKDWTKSKNFKHLGKMKDIPFDKLKMGDVWMIESHVCMYIGHGRIVEASSANWSKGSISCKDGAKSRYQKYQNKPKANVCRYVG